MSQVIHTTPTSDIAEQERRVRCRDWLMYVMTNPPDDGETKEALCVETMKLCRVSRGSFENCWSEAIERRDSRTWRLVLRTD